MEKGIGLCYCFRTTLREAQGKDLKVVTERDVIKYWIFWNSVPEIAYSLQFFAIILQRSRRRKQICHNKYHLSFLSLIVGDSSIKYPKNARPVFVLFSCFLNLFSFQNAQRGKSIIVSSSIFITYSELGHHFCCHWKATPV